MRLHSVLLLVVSISLSGVRAHSWVACSDYRGDVNYYDETKCFGYPRGWGPKSGGVFGSDNGMNYMPDGRPCQSAFGTTYPAEFPMATYEQGGVYCLAWPTKNHAAAECTNGFIPDTSTNVFVSGVNPKSDPSQLEFKKFNINDMDGAKGCAGNKLKAECQLGGTKHEPGKFDCKAYQRAPKFCENTDKALAHGCFTIPKNMEVGEYVMQWYWEFNAGSVYSTCFDVKVVAEGAGNGEGGTTGQPENPEGFDAGACTNNAEEIKPGYVPKLPPPRPAPAGGSGTGVVPSADCKDIASDCEMQKKSWSMCGNDWWGGQCKKTCGTCSPPPATTTTTTTTTTTPQVPGQQQPTPQGKAVVLTEGFENGIPFTNVILGGGTVVVDTSRFHTGKQSVKVSGNNGFSTMFEVTDAKVFPTKKFYGRAYVLSDTAMQAGHNTYMCANEKVGMDSINAQSVRIGEHRQMLEVNLQNPDVEQLSSGDYNSMTGALTMSANQWYCIEFMFDAQKDEMKVWFEGQEATNLYVQDWNGAASKWSPQEYASMKFGFEKYHGGSKDLWYDDIAFGTERVGCLSSSSGGGSSSQQPQVPSSPKLPATTTLTLTVNQDLSQFDEDAFKQAVADAIGGLKASDIQIVTKSTGSTVVTFAFWNMDPGAEKAATDSMKGYACPLIPNANCATLAEGNFTAEMAAALPSVPIEEKNTLQFVSAPGQFCPYQWQDKVSVTLEYNAARDAALVVDVLQSEKWFGKGEMAVKAGHGTVTMDVVLHKGLTNEMRYEFKAWLVEASVYGQMKEPWLFEDVRVTQEFMAGGGVCPEPTAAPTPQSARAPLRVTMKQGIAGWDGGKFRADVAKVAGVMASDVQILSVVQGSSSSSSSSVVEFGFWGLDESAEQAAVELLKTTCRKLENADCSTLTTMTTVTTTAGSQPPSPSSLGGAGKKEGEESVVGVGVFAGVVVACIVIALLVGAGAAMILMRMKAQQLSGSQGRGSRGAEMLQSEYKGEV